MNKSVSPGKVIIPGGVFPEDYELETAEFFAAIGKEVEFIRPSAVKGLKNPDIQMDGKIWEIKVLTGKSKGTIERRYKIAERQSENIIFDLRKIKMDEQIAVKIIKQQFYSRKHRVNTIIIILRNCTTLDISR